MNTTLIIEIKIVEPGHTSCSVWVPERSHVLVHEEVHITEETKPSESCSCGKGKILEKKIYFCQGPRGQVSGFSVANAVANYCQSVVNLRMFQV